MFEKFHGTLTLENLDKVAQMVLKTLDGKRYTFASFNELGHQLEVRTGQRLNHRGSTSGCAVNTYFDKEQDPPRHGGFHVGDSYGVWGTSTSIHADGYYYDPKFDNPYIVITRDQIRITHRAPAGHMLWWIAAVENDD
jgi:hypothetical protein